MILHLPPSQTEGFRFHEAPALKPQLVEGLQHPIRTRVLEFLDRLAKILPPPRIHRHRYHGVFAPIAPLRPLVTARAQEENTLADQESFPDDSGARFSG